MAVVCIVVTVFAATPIAADELDSPLRVRFSLADGASVTGDLNSWDQTGFDGTFGRRAWSDLAVDDLWRLYRAVMDQDNAAQWINLGRLLLVEDDARNAERAFSRALRLDENAKPRIEQARAAALAELAKQREQQQRAEEQKLNTQHPEAAEYSADPWPMLTAEQQELHADVMRGRAASILDRAGVDARLIETNRFLFYSQMSHAESLRWARLLDRCYDNLAKAVGVDSIGNIFWGKAVVIIHDDYDRFRVTEADTFNHLSPRSVHGLMHPDGPRVFLNVHRDSDDFVFGELLCTLTTYAFLHRHISPRRLPAWAADGLALYATHKAFDLSTVEQSRRPFGLKFIREQPGGVKKLLALDYADEQWPGPERVGPAVGYLLVEMLSRDKSGMFARWVRSVKIGTDWPEALSQVYGASASAVIKRFVQWYRVNN